MAGVPVFHGIFIEVKVSKKPRLDMYWPEDKTLAEVAWSTRTRRERETGPGNGKQRS
jgi:hypothetical protein